MPVNVSTNVLTRPNSRRLEDWLFANKTRLESEDQGSFNAVAEAAGNALGITITQANVRSCSETMGVTIKIAGKSPLASFMVETQTHRNRLDALEARLAAIEKKLGLPSVLPKAAGQPASIC